MSYKGFAKAPTKKLLIKGWLIKENSEYYKFRDNTLVLESLPMTLNMWLAMASDRFVIQQDRQSVMNALTLIATLDTELTLKPAEESWRWLQKLKTNDEFYISYYHRLLNLVKDAIATNRYAELNGCIQNTWEYKEWMQEAGYLLATPNLKDGWLHPLSESTTVEGEEVMNFWAVASVLAAAATERTTDGGDKETCITRLIQLGVLDVETDFRARLKVAHFIDAEYLEIINQTKEALDKAVIPNLPQS